MTHAHDGNKKNEAAFIRITILTWELDVGSITASVKRETSFLVIWFEVECFLFSHTGSQLYQCICLSATLNKLLTLK